MNVLSVKTCLYDIYLYSQKKRTIVLLLNKYLNQRGGEIC